MSDLYFKPRSFMLIVYSLTMFVAWYLDSFPIVLPVSMLATICITYAIEWAVKEIKTAMNDNDIQD